MLSISPSKPVRNRSESRICARRASADARPSAVVAQSRHRGLSGCCPTATVADEIVRMRNVSDRIRGVEYLLSIF